MDSFFEYVPVKDLVKVVVYTIAGLILFVGGFAALDAITRRNIWKELHEEKNLPMSIVVAAGMIGLAIIISAAIR